MTGVVRVKGVPVEMGGQTFYDGKETELNTDDNGALLDKLQGNQHFDVEIGEE